MSPSGEKLFRENSAEKICLLRKTNSAHKRSQLGSQITDPISAWRVYFRLPPGEIYARNLQSILVFRIALKADRIRFAARIFLKLLEQNWERNKGNDR